MCSSVCLFDGVVFLFLYLVCVGMCGGVVNVVYDAGVMCVVCIVCLCFRAVSMSCVLRARCVCYVFEICV